MNAVVSISKNQYLVSPGDRLSVPRLQGSVGEHVVFDSVNLLFSDSDVIVGEPYVKGAKVNAVIRSHTKGDKIEVSRYKSKVRYRKHMGFRPSLTELEITAITK